MGILQRPWTPPPILASQHLLPITPWFRVRLSSGDSGHLSTPIIQPAAFQHRSLSSPGVGPDLRPLARSNWFGSGQGARC